jgi:hypothetical protein
MYAGREALLFGDRLQKFRQLRLLRVVQSREQRAMMFPGRLTNFRQTLKPFWSHVQRMHPPVGRRRLAFHEPTLFEFIHNPDQVTGCIRNTFANSCCDMPGDFASMRSSPAW